MKKKTKKKKKLKVSNKVKWALAERVDKYKKGLQKLQIGTRKDGELELQLKNFAAAHLRLLLIEEAVRKIKPPLMLLPYYMGFGRQVDKIRKKHEGPARDSEIKAVMGSWILRGLDKDILKEVQKKVEEII